MFYALKCEIIGEYLRSNKNMAQTSRFVKLSRPMPKVL